MCGAWVGRQTDGSRDDPVLAVSAWRSLADLEAPPGPQAPLFAGHVGEEFTVDRIELFDVFAIALRDLAVPA